MPMKWSYLGKLGPEGKLDWGGAWSGNIPVSGHILPDLDNIQVYMKIRKLAGERKLEGHMVDWGAFAIKVNGPELLKMLSECYEDIETADPESLIGRYVGYAQALGSDNYVAFLSVEL